MRSQGLNGAASGGTADPLKSECPLCGDLCDAAQRAVVAVSAGALKTTQAHCTNQATGTTFPVFLRDPHCSPACGCKSGASRSCKFSGPPGAMIQTCFMVGVATQSSARVHIYSGGDPE